MEIIHLLFMLSSLCVLIIARESNSYNGRYQYHKFARQYRKREAHGQCGIATVRNRYQMIGSLVGGVESVKGFYPWQVALYYYDEFLCGGSLITKRHVLTAAHCFNGIADDSRNIFIVLGEYNRLRNEGTEQEVRLKKLTVNENFNYGNNQNDIAIIELAEDAKLSDYIETICLPRAGEERAPGSKCMMSGWGKPYVTGDAVAVLKEMEVPVVDRVTCHKRNRFSGKDVTDKMMCVGYDNGVSFVSGCQGDSGGPLSCKTANGIWKVFGVVSWGSRVCNGLDRYTVFTKVSAYLPWIHKHTS